MIFPKQIFCLFVSLSFLETICIWPLLSVEKIVTVICIPLRYTNSEFYSSRQGHHLMTRSPVLVKTLTSVFMPNDILETYIFSIILSISNSVDLHLIFGLGSFLLKKILGCCTKQTLSPIVSAYHLKIL